MDCLILPHTITYAGTGGRRTRSYAFLRNVRLKECCWFRPGGAMSVTVEQSPRLHCRKDNYHCLAKSSGSSGISPQRNNHYSAVNQSEGPPVVILQLAFSPYSFISSRLSLKGLAFERFLLEVVETPYEFAFVFSRAASGSIS